MGHYLYAIYLGFIGHWKYVGLYVGWASWFLEDKYL